MILPLLAAFLVPSAGPPAQGGMVPSRGTSLGPPVAGVDLRPLLAMGDQATMLAPARERWAIATIEAVGVPRDLANRGGKWEVFDVRLRVLDGRNLATGTLDAFWSEDDTHGRRALLRQMIGERVLVRLAPVRDGRFLIVSGVDDDPEITTTFADTGTPLLNLVLPTAATTLDPGTPAQMRFASLWRAGGSLSASAYPLFERYVSAAQLPVTSRSPKVDIRAAGGGLIGDARPAGPDVLWLRRFARDVSPEFALMTEENLSRNDVMGSGAVVRDLIRLSLRQPERFPNGLFRVLDPIVVRESAWEDPTWPPTEAIVRRLAKRPGIDLTQDLLSVLRFSPTPPEGRAALLPLLTDPEPRVRSSGLAAFAAWHGTPPAGTDPVAWHTARAKLGREALAAAMAAPGG